MDRCRRKYSSRCTPSGTYTQLLRDCKSKIQEIKIDILERIPQTIEQYKEKNAALAKDIPLLKEIAGKQWKKEDELKGLKSELAALDRKIQLELAKDKEPVQEVINGENQKEGMQITKQKLQHL